MYNVCDDKKSRIISAYNKRATCGISVVLDEISFDNLTVANYLKCLRMSSIHVKTLKIPLVRQHPKRLKCHCNEKIFDPILGTTEQHF